MRSIILLAFILFLKQVNGQVSEGLLSIPDRFKPQLNTTPTLHTDIECNKGHFWSVTPGGDIFEWRIAGGVVVFSDTVMLNTPINSIAFADTMNPSNIWETFYGSDGHDFMYYDGTNWITLSPANNTAWIGNCGAYQNYLFFTAIMPNNTNNGSPHTIYRFDGINLTQIVSLASGRNFSVADLAIDDNGNIWTITGISTNGDSLVQYSPNGTQLQSFPFSFDSYHSYGAFMINNTYYVGLGSANPVYPSTLAIISVSGGIGIVQDTISFPNSDFNDLASCLPGQFIPLAIGETESTSTYEIYPNPTSGEFQLMLPDKFSFPLDLEIYDIMGNKIFSDKINSSFISLPAELPSGVYYLRIMEFEVERIIKISGR